ncbi:hypothetical protein ACQPUL_12065 [Clostridium butyricum]
MLTISTNEYLTLLVIVMKYIVCFEGDSSAFCAIECVRKAGRENAILLNDNISEEVEDKDIKKFTENCGFKHNTNIFNDERNGNKARIYELSDKIVVIEYIKQGNQTYR